MSLVSSFACQKIAVRALFSINIQPLVNVSVFDLASTSSTKQLYILSFIVVVVVYLLLCA